MSRTAMIRVPDDAPEPDGFIGWFTVRPPRRYAVVVDLAAWTEWVREHAPEHIAACGHVDRGFEAAVRKWVAATGAWSCACESCVDDDHPDGRDVTPDGVEPRTDSAVRIHLVTPAGTRWESPVDLMETRTS